MAVTKKRPAAAEDLNWLDVFEDDADASALPETGEDPAVPEKPQTTPAERRRAHRARAKGKKQDRREKDRAPGKKHGKPAADDTEAATGKGKRRAPRRRRSFKESLLRLLVKLAVIAIAIYVLTQIVGGVFVAHDNNMYPAVRDGDLCITFRLGGYYNGDVVAFEQDGMTTFGRVVGISGDVIDIREETGFQVNGMTPYEVVYYQTKPQDPAVTYPYTVQEGEWFVLCDQREDAPDSRSFGGIKELKGKVVLQLRRRGF